MNGLGEFGIRLPQKQLNESVRTGEKDVYRPSSDGIASLGDKEGVNAVTPMKQIARQRDVKEEKEEKILFAETLVGDARESLSSLTSLRFNVDDELGKVVIRVVDNQSKEVIRQIPTNDMLELARRIHDMKGLLFDEEV